jgi:glycosyltransferase involved in cell wall biosynthesis
MRVAVGIPSYQEADSIAHVVLQVDRGLARRFGADRSMIVNVDGASPDGTAAVFRGVPTTCRKVSLSVTDRPGGKGANVLRFLRHCLDHDVEALAMIDADVSSITPEWIDRLLGPVVDGPVDFVAPFYRRSRYDGATTAHFAYPYFYAITGLDLRQPIGGDVGMSAALARHVVGQSVDDAVRGYGIDIFLSLHAARGNFRIAQASLGRKLHKPSFPKRIQIVRDVIGAGLAVGGQWDVSADAHESSAPPCSIDDAGEFTHRYQANALSREAQVRATSLWPLYRRWLGADHGALRAALDGSSPSLSAEGWTDVLAAALAAWRATGAGSPVDEVVDGLEPLHLIRSVTFWNESCAGPADAVEAEIVAQARLFRSKLLTHGGSHGRTPRSA